MSEPLVTAPIDEPCANWLRRELRARTGCIVIESSNDVLMRRTIDAALAAERHVVRFWSPVLGERADEISDNGIAPGTTFNAEMSGDLLSHLSRILAAREEEFTWRLARADGTIFNQAPAPSRRDAPDRDRTRAVEAAIARQQAQRAATVAVPSTPVHRTYVLAGSDIWLRSGGQHFDPLTLELLIEVIRAIRGVALNLVLIVPSGTQFPARLTSLCSWWTDGLPDREKLSALFHDQFLGAISAAMLNTVKPLEVAEPTIDRLMGLSLEQARNALTSAIVHAALGDTPAPQQEFLHLLEKTKEQAIKASAALEIQKPIPIERIGGLEILKSWLAGRAKALTPEARRRGIPSPRGVLFLGPAGSGKSACAKATASIFGLPLVRFDVGAVFGSLVGESEEGVRTALRTADAMAPCVLFIDEVEKALGGVDGANDGGTTKRVFGSILTWMSDRPSHSPPVFVVMTANDVRALPPELMRRGRLDEIFFVDLPNDAERAQILAIHLAAANYGVPKEFHIALSETQIQTAAAATAGFTGAEIEAALTEARVEAFRHDEAFQLEHLLGAITATTPLSTTRREQLASLREWAVGRARPASTAPAKTVPKKRNVVVSGDLGEIS